VAFREISMAKLVAGDLAQEIAYDAMQFHGATGYMAESDVARAWRDLRLLTIGGGTSEIMKELVSRGAGM
jgi:alkylation response protein AidB-like acyl-CoA dehydrogenase